MMRSLSYLWQQDIGALSKMIYLIIYNIVSLLLIGNLYYQHYKKPLPNRVVTKNILPPDFQVKITLTPPAEPEKQNVIKVLQTGRSSYDIPRSK